MDLFTSLALRSLGAANEVKPLRPALFAADLPRTLPDGLEETSMTREVEAPPSRPSTSSAPYAVEPTAQRTSAPAAVRIESHPAEPFQAQTSRPLMHITRPAHEALQPNLPTQPIAAVSPRMEAEASRERNSSVPATERQTTSIETTHKIHTREIVPATPSIERNVVVEREVVREIVREAAALGVKSSPLVAPIRPQQSSLLIPTIAAPRPPALDLPATPPPAPVIQVTIGRVEVSAVPPARANRPQPRLADTPPGVSLNDYLRDPKARAQ